MHWLVKIVGFFVVLAIGNVIYKLRQTSPVPNLPDTWWGPGDPTKENKEIRPFKINVSNAVLDDLKHRLKTARPFTAPLEGVQQQYGINANLLEEIVQFWTTKYDWRESEKFLNQYPQYKTDVQGISVHFVHVKPKNVPANVKVVPLLLTHGWPGSFREFYEIIPLLTTPRKGQGFVFEAIVPSIPGYGFSQAAVRPGLGPVQVAVIFKNLMQRLGFSHFYAQGGDWGAAVSANLAVLYPEIVKGIHLNMCVSNLPISNLKLIAGSFWPSLLIEEELKHKLYPLSDLFSYLALEFGYFHLQATKPDTVGVSLNDSPVGLAAYILEKFTSWTNYDWIKRADGGLTEKFTYTKLLDNVMIYWVTNSITTSMRLYAESMADRQNSLDNHPVLVPSACAMFKNEIMYQPESILRDKFHHLVQANKYNDGGHFAALEVPDQLANDIWLAVSKFENPKK